MPAPVKRYALPADHANYVEALVASGAYASPEDVIGAGLRALQTRDAEIDRWLNTEVANAYDALQANPSSAIPAEEVFASIRAEHAARVKHPARAL